MSDSDDRPASAAPAAAPRDRLLLAAFWAWAAILAVAAVAQLFRIQPILDVLDVKSWFAR